MRRVDQVGKALDSLMSKEPVRHDDIETLTKTQNALTLALIADALLMITDSLERIMVQMEQESLSD